MDRRYVALLLYVVAFGVLFAVALTPLMQGLIGLGLDNTAAALVAWFAVILVPLVPARLVKDL
jgi:hypothetical protein